MVLFCSLCNNHDLSRLLPKHDDTAVTPVLIPWSCCSIMPSRSEKSAIVNTFEQHFINTQHIHQHMIMCYQSCSVLLQWHHNERDGVSNHQSHDCLLNCLFRCRWKKTSKLGITDLCVENSLVTSEFPAPMVSNTENFFIWWCHHFDEVLVKKDW